MPFIRTVSESDATGLLKTIYDQAVARAGKVFNILAIQSPRPDVLHASMLMYVALMKKPGELAQASKEMIAVLVSLLNDCFY